ncbi:MAG: hypothetical protein H0V46_01085 [Sphingomonas sp.]|nr:hypothetical protein [Sphingomonas sp.]
MLNERLAAARKVADQLLPAEADLDSAILHASRLAIAVIEGAKTAKLPIDTGQEGLALVARASAKLVEARGEILAAHVAFRETQDDIGLRTLSFGDLWVSPDKKGALADDAAQAA